MMFGVLLRVSCSAIFGCCVYFCCRFVAVGKREKGQLLVSVKTGQREGGTKGSSLHLGQCSYSACIWTCSVLYVVYDLRTDHPSFFWNTDVLWTLLLPLDTPARGWRVCFYIMDDWQTWYRRSLVHHRTNSHLLVCSTFWYLDIRN
jgi:hypothetical protein